MTVENPLRGNKIGYLTNLTPMRGIAAMLTVIFHIDLFMGGALVPVSSSMVLQRMYLMVDFFFILSGFIMCYVYGNRFTDGVRKKDFKKFTIARFSRVYPLHLFTLIFTVVLLTCAAKLGVPKFDVMEIDNNAYSVLTNVLLLHSMNLHNWFTWVHASWSISTEWWAYMIFPFLVAPFVRLKSLGRLLVCLVCFAGYLCIMFLLVPIVTVPPSMPFLKESVDMHTINVAYQYGIVRCLCGFILGMMMHHAYADQWGRKILGNGWVMILLTIGAFTCMHFYLADVFTVAFFPFLLLCGAYGSKGIDRVFSTRPMQRIGDWSFSIYLVHQPLMILILKIMDYINLGKPPSKDPQQAPTFFQAWTIALIIIGLVLFISYLTYRFIENPARRWLNSKAAADPALVSN